MIYFFNVGHTKAPFMRTYQNEYVAEFPAMSEYSSIVTSKIVIYNTTTSPNYVDYFSNWS
jgi:hypothetical protein